MAEDTITEILELPEGVTVSEQSKELSITGAKGTVMRKINNPRVKLEVKGREIILVAAASTKKDKTVIKTYVSHIRNAIKGVTEGYTYKLKICSGHFPMNVSVSNNVLEIKNFLGEKVPRKVKLKEDVSVKVDGSFITVESQDKEKAGQVAADIEQTTRRPGFDKRIFQDGIYIIDKAGQEI